MKSLLVEIVTEELPPKALKALGEAFASAMADALRHAGVLGNGSAVTGYATPRRLAVVITHVLASSPDTEANDKLMPVKVALADGKPTDALRKKLAALGHAQLADATPLMSESAADALYVASDGRADYVYLRRRVEGETLAHAVQCALDTTLSRLPIPKLMRYAAPGHYYNDVEFVRPAHRLVALHGAEVVPVRALGLDAGNVSAGHRVLARADLRIADADAYAPTLEAEGKVLPSF
ncbi:MAG TPA: glycine--tRNA ligase subunit beta, partial [Casimicrobiaceae bacterium]